MNGPKVLMFGWEFPPYNSGGLGTACLGLSHALAEKNVDLTFVLPKSLRVDDQYLHFIFAGIENIDFKRIPSPLYPYITSSAYQSLVGKDSSGFYGGDLIAEVLAYGDRAQAIVQKASFDIIHAHDWLSFPAGIRAKQYSGRPLVVHVHATEFDRTGGVGDEQIYNIEKKGMEAADAIIAVSGRTKQMAVDYYGIDPKKIFVVHNGIIDPTPPCLMPALQELKNSGKKIILFVGRITLQKGPDYFVRMAKAVLDHDDRAYFVVAGSGDMQPQMMKEAAALGISNRFLFAGFARGEELDRLYRAADVYVLPSVSEPFGITVLEAMAAGAPIIISKQSGVSEIVKNALLVDFWDVEAMAGQVLAVLREPSLQGTMQQEARQEVCGITWREAAEKVLAVYRSLLLKPQAI